MATTQKGIYYPNDYSAIADIPEEMQTMAESIDTAIDNTGVTGKEDKLNKVTSISSSSTDTQYPSAKCVYNSIKAVSDLVDSANTILEGV